MKLLKLAATVAALAVPTFVSAQDVKIGFIVKQPEEPWFQDEWKFADIASVEKGFKVIQIGAVDGEKVMAAIDNLGAQGVDGFIICTPDVNLGPGIVAKAAANGLKLMTVDDRLIGANGEPMKDVPHMGISARKIGEDVGKAIAEAATERGWGLDEIGVVRVSYDQLPTAVDRVDGALDMLRKAGVSDTHIFDAPQARTDTEAALNAATIVLNKNPDVKYWAAVGLNDEAVLGAVRAAESVGINPDHMIGVGIGGSDSAINEFEKPDATGFYGTVIISPKRHGYETAMNMYEWITEGKEPDALILTSGALATRSDYQEVRASLGIE
ncbi:arabinose ABC transporter substrate-binding protein [Marinovum sp. 2_MG-2023]|uniref:arabinose ABC transporter substrate-binding protein n=1 Tax=unclassified Marinovum TaxID=2647166 RepID=UPI0026E2C8C1|nr:MULTISPECIES: arabinose ABC transporter substrate-binding protein [unclassified Marinovum]MDO6732682.1 arabinose ABC transporter substrate-binding protein [Marinovum sp. 2_MG-2023]MDO6781955.1 arabinose ABC transporter substrate-binding protein [Marinovum sp. 1_MG-2023]